MSLGIKVYKMKDFIRKTESGDIDFDKSIQIVQELSAASAFHADHNILIDLRETTHSVSSMAEIMEIAMEFAQHMSSFKNKIANLIPKNANRILMAEKLEACIRIKNFQYKVFSDFEDAIEWLSEIR